MYEKRYTFTLTGLAPLIMHWDNIEWADQIADERTRIKEDDKANFKAGDDRCPAFTWKGYTYNDLTHVCLPSDNIRSCLIKAAAKITLKNRETYKKLAASGILMDEMYFDLFVGGKQIPFKGVDAIEGPFKTHLEAVKALGFKLLVKRASVGASKHVRVRPMFDNWVLQGSVVLVEEQITFKVLKEIWSIAGPRIGLCDWRPGASKSPGPYGRFKTELTAA